MIAIILHTFSDRKSSFPTRKQVIVVSPILIKHVDNFNIMLQSFRFKVFKLVKFQIVISQLFIVAYFLITNFWTCFFCFMILNHYPIKHVLTKTWQWFFKYKNGVGVSLAHSSFKLKLIWKKQNKLIPWMEFYYLLPL